MISPRAGGIHVRVVSRFYNKLVVCSQLDSMTNLIYVFLGCDESEREKCSLEEGTGIYKKRLSGKAS